MPAANTLRMLVCSAVLTVTVLFPAIDSDAAQSLRQVREKWIGQNVGRLIEQNGYPEQVFESQGGNKVYTYVKTKRRMYSVPIYIPPTTRELDVYHPNSGSYSYGISNSPGTWAFEYRTREATCTGYFEVDSGHTIVGVRFKGEDCPK